MSNPEISGLGLGCWSFGGDEYWGKQKHTDSIKTIRAALRGGVTHFDTAANYANGRSEQVTGQQLKKVRDKVTIATKSLYHPPENLQKAIDTSLRRLCTGYVDIFYLHWPSKGKDFRPLMEILEKNRQKGKIRAIGVSNFTVPMMEDLLHFGKIDYCQAGCSLLWRQPDKEMIPFCRKKGIKIAAYSPLAQGILTEKFVSAPAFQAGDPRNKLVFFKKENKEQLEVFLSRLKGISAKKGISVSLLSLAWILGRKDIQLVIAGARNREQAEENIKAMHTSLDQETAGELTALSDELTSRLSMADNIFDHSVR